MNPIITQTIYYGILMIATILCISFIMKGFFWQYMKVRMSFGKYVMVKIKKINRDDYAVGRIEEGFLVYKCKDTKAEKRIAIADGSVIYRSLAIAWIDTDGQKNSIIKHTDDKEVSGFDATKTSNLLTRALTKPSTNFLDQGRITIFLLIGIGIAVLIVGYISYMNYTNIPALSAQIASLSERMITNTTGVVMGIV